MANPPNTQMPQRFTGTLRRMSTGPYTVTRQGIVSIVKGRAILDPNPQIFTIFASIQPISPQDLFRLPEGQRVEDSATIWSETELQEPDAISGAEGDIIAVGTRAYQVQRIFEWGASGSYVKCIAKRIGQ